MRREDYLHRVRMELGDLPARHRDAALSDLADLLDEDGPGDPLNADDQGDASTRTVLETLGSPQEYAAQVRAAFPTDDAADHPVGRILGVPVEVRGPLSAAVRSRVWDPANPAVFVPRLLGAGWTVNLGAVAVRLGLLRPDDYDEDVLHHVPPGARRLAQATPALISAATATAVARRWPSLPARTPVEWNLAGRPRRWADRRSLLLLVGLGAAAALWAWLPASEQDRLIRSSLATWLAGVSAASVAATLRDAESGPGDSGHGQLVPLGMAGSAAAAFLVLYLPIRAGLRAVWRERVLVRAGEPA
ncbi:MAG TPA: DUF1648 domain-containing protein [Dermatophilaceae bacterium]|nr:DUF1648 domain-containing protein [Dermatophilaceae bacterium]